MLRVESHEVARDCRGEPVEIAAVVMVAVTDRKRRGCRSPDPTRPARPYPSATGRTRTRPMHPVGGCRARPSSSADTVAHRRLDETDTARRRRSAARVSASTTACSAAPRRSCSTAALARRRSANTRSSTGSPTVTSGATTSPVSVTVHPARPASVDDGERRIACRCQRRRGLVQRVGASHYAQRGAGCVTVRRRCRGLGGRAARPSNPSASSTRSRAVRLTVCAADPTLLRTCAVSINASARQARKSDRFIAARR